MDEISMHMVSVYGPSMYIYIYIVKIHTIASTNFRKPVNDQVMLLSRVTFF